MSGAPTRYTALAIVLHWAIAGAIVLMIALGLWMHELAESGAASDGLFRAYQLHKSIGLTILALSLARLAWRLFNPPPSLPSTMKTWERSAATATHWLFYALMIGLPLSGWLYVSAGWSLHEDTPLAVATRWFGLFEVPHLFGLDAASEAVRASTAAVAFRAHALMSWTMVGLLALHVVAALKHHFIDADGVLARMVPGLRTGGEPAPREPLRLALLGAGLSLTTVALVTAAFAWADMAGGVRLSSAAPPSLTLEAPATPAVAPASPGAGAATAPSAPTAIANSDDAPPSWSVDATHSTIGWSFTYTEGESAQRFDGRFTQWIADIRFDPENLEASNVSVRIAVGSATDGVPLHDSSLPTPEWFNAAAHPQAEFRASRFTHLGGDNYRADGQLTLRGQTRPVALPFTLRIDGERAVVDGRVSLDRRAFGVGSGADADDAISASVDVVVRVEATRNR